MAEIKPAGYISAPTFVGAKHIKNKVDKFYSIHTLIKRFRKF